jgi:Family of unknown function (DUF5788)
MTGRRNIVEDISEDIGAYLTEEERKCLLSDLHLACAWVGVKIPENINVDRDVLNREMEEHGLTEKDQPPEVHTKNGTVDLQALIWTLIHKTELTEKERSEIEELIHVIDSKERYDENLLKEMKLTHGEAKRIHEETTGIIRAILDLKDLLKNKNKSEAQEELIRKKVEDARKWQSFMEQMKEKRDYQ